MSETKPLNSSGAILIFHKKKNSCYPTLLCEVSIMHVMYSEDKLSAVVLSECNQLRYLPCFLVIRNAIQEDIGVQYLSA